MGVGPISQSDVQLAVPLGARILGFNVRPAGAEVEALAKQHGLDIRQESQRGERGGEWWWWWCKGHRVRGYLLPRG